jgi:anti-sigma factor RsiW
MKPEEARELLPWYAAGALDPAEARSVEAALRQSPQLDQELAEWRALQSNVARVGDDEPAFRPELIEDAHRRIDAFERTKQAARRQRDASQGDRTTRSLLESIFGVWNATPFGVRIAVAAQFAALAVLAGVLLARVPGETTFTTASGTNLTAEAGRRINVLFQPESTASEIQSVLAAAGAQIVAGPSGQDSYVIDVGEVDDQQLAQTLEQLRASTGVVRFATPAE